MNPLSANVSKPLAGGASYSLMHRLFRVVWNIIWAVFASWTPAPLHRWRVVLLRLAGANIHRSAHVYGTAKIWYPPNLTMEANACLGPDVDCYCMAPIFIGRNAIVSQGSYLCGGTHDIEDPEFQLIIKPIVIHESAWVAAESFVGPGVTIGKGAVLGARCVLFKDAQPMGVYVGNPAKLIRLRGTVHG